MRPRSILACLGAAALMAALALSAGKPEPSAAHAAPPEGDPEGAPRVALLATRPGATTPALHLAQLGAADAGEPVATLEHLPDPAIRASVLPGTDVVMAITDVTPGRDLSFNAALFRVQPGAPAARLCDQVVYASRPLVTPVSRIFVTRGVAGPAPAPGADGKLQMRVDALSIDEVDPATGATRVVHTLSGYHLFLAAAWKHELIVYRVTPGGADLVALDPDSGAERKLAELLPFARSFSLDEPAGALIFQERHEADPRTWVIDRLDLATGARTRLHTSPHIALSPHAWPGGGVAYTPDRRLGLTVQGAPVSVRAPMGPGAAAVQAVAPDGAWLGVLHQEGGALPVPYALRSSTGDLAAIPAPPGARVFLAGFVASSAKAEVTP